MPVIDGTTSPFPQSPSPSLTQMHPKAGTAAEHLALPTHFLFLTRASLQRKSAARPSRYMRHPTEIVHSPMRQLFSKTNLATSLRRVGEQGLARKLQRLRIGIACLLPYCFKNVSKMQFKCLWLCEKLLEINQASRPRKIQCQYSDAQVECRKL